MDRLLYAALLQMHPRAFRQRFGAEMVGILDETSGVRARIGLLADAVASLFRQWVLRPTAPPAPALSSGGMFQSFIEPDAPRRSALVNGAALSVALLGLLVFGIGKGGSHVPRSLIGARYPRPNVLPVDRSSIAEGTLTTEVHVASPAVDPLYELANVYFGIIRVLHKLDADGDRIISRWEILTAPGPLRRLDVDTDGALSPYECGASRQPLLDSKARREFMRAHPVLAVLDADRNGGISADEITRSAGALRGLDKNRDGSLTPVEVLPERALIP